uniref:Cytochrome P450 2J6-like n=1 Tax=Acanthochromis polyacanthus TaxID=80966 RepID=A0A3Q1FYC2_9TELE
MDSVFSLIGSYIDWNFKSLLLLTVVFIIAADFVKNCRPVGFPPGPWAFPVVGNLFSFDHTRTHEVLTQYGDVYSLRMGKKWLVVVNRSELLKEALITQGDSLADRPDLPMSQDITVGRGMTFTSGHIWRQQRRFALSTLRNFGFAKTSLQPVILDEFSHCAEEFRRYEGKPFNPHLVMNNAVSNIICSLLFGHRFEYSDEKFQKLLRWFGVVLHTHASIWAQLYNSFTGFMRFLPGPHQTIKQISQGVKDFIRAEINEHKKNWDPSTQRDYIDCYLNEIQMGKDENTFDEENMIICVMDLFVAGSETTSTTLRWGFLYMAKYPEIQEKVQAEIDRVIGQSRQPSMEDRANLPYTDAVIHEIQRMGNIVPLSLPHLTNRDVQLGGYNIPKGFAVIPNLTSEGKFVKPAAFIPFSAGKRLCPGESLAKMELFLFFTCFMQHFNFSMPAGVKPVTDFLFGITLSPKEYEICATSRQE